MGISDEELREITEKAQAEKQILMKQAQDDMKKLIDQQRYDTPTPSNTQNTHSFSFNPHILSLPASLKTHIALQPSNYTQPCNTCIFSINTFST